MKFAVVAVVLVGFGVNADGPNRRLSCMQSPDGGVYDCMPGPIENGGGVGTVTTTTTEDTGQITVGGEVNAGVVKGTWQVRSPSITTTTVTTRPASTDGVSK